ncbi:MAG: M36 family metallopeptidase, partial [Planctomycetaceae bacterium]|nr:M36 family metallopeptidase [Planctomycetaceae bacterium]
MAGIKSGRNGRARQRACFWEGEFLESRELLSSTSLALDFTQYQAQSPPTRLTNQSGFLTGPTSGQPLEIAIDYLKDYSVALGLTPQDIDSLEVTNSYQSSVSQVTHIYFQQVVNGIPVVNSSLNINITKYGEVINVGSSILPSVATNTVTPDPQLSALQALNSLVTSLGWTYEGTPGLVATTVGSVSQETLLSSAGISRTAEIPAALRYVPREDGSVELAWLLNIQTTDGQSWYDAAVSSSSGQLLNLEDWVNQASYRGIEIPFENPQEHATSLIIDPQSRSNASPFGWHDTDGVAGPEFTDTRGNNVFAQEDKDDNDTGGNRPDGGAALVFDFPFDPALDAQANENAAIVNLFYWNNVIHDVLYNYGFDETAGNFQFNNYGKGGIGGDQVEADALDGSGVNNANFATPPDGISGRMQMFEFTFTTPTRDSDLDSFIIVHEFGHGLSNRLTGGPANAGALIQAQSRGMGEGWSDFLALMFTQKSTDAQFDAYSTGNYVLGNPLNDPNGGIRDFPYSFDLSVSPKTYGDFQVNSFPHPNGEIIAATLWDLNWLMINGNGTSISGKGFEPDIYNSASGRGNTELMQIFVEALKLQPSNPTYLDFRDAVLAADRAITGGENSIAIWTAFARRGMGFSASDGGSAASGSVEEAFDLPPGLLFEFTVTPNPVFENAGIGGASGMLKRPASIPINTALTVSLTSSDTSEIQVPVNVTIPAGSASATFPIDIIDDNVLDGTQTVTLTATTTVNGGVRVVSAIVNVLDHETLSFEITPASIHEDAGQNAATVKLTRFETIGDLVVTLSNSAPSELSIPSTVTFPDGADSVTFSVDAVDDNVRDGLQTVTISAVAFRYQSNSATIDVEDSEIIHVDVVADKISEAAGPAATQVKVSRSDTAGPFDYVTTQTFTNPDIFGIPDNGTLYSQIIVPAQASRITDLNVTVNFKHEWLGDLDVFLISPNGTQITLFTDLLSSGTQLVGTILDDQSSVSIQSGAAPFTGRFAPQQPLGTFNMESPVGTWLLKVVDDNATDFGELLGWSMTMETVGLSETTVVLETSNIGKAGFHGNATTTVVIPANQSEAFVPLDAIDNNILDGNTVVTIRAIGVNVAGLGLGSDTVIVTDKESLAFTTSVSTVSE